ncbi:hypothetical protein C8F01DRAFT_1092697 [Mycena amicta]|nr:hypothetical protein C8F01DRAFT_1092697 [Mycena amicta]
MTPHPHLLPPTRTSRTCIRLKRCRNDKICWRYESCTLLARRPQSATRLQPTYPFLHHRQFKLRQPSTEKRPQRVGQVVPVRKLVHVCETANTLPQEQAMVTRKGVRSFCACPVADCVERGDIQTSGKEARPMFREVELVRDAVVEEDLEVVWYGSGFGSVIWLLASSKNTQQNRVKIVLLQFESEWTAGCNTCPYSGSDQKHAAKSGEDRALKASRTSALPVSGIAGILTLGTSGEEVQGVTMRRCGKVHTALLCAKLGLGKASVAPNLHLFAKLTPRSDPPHLQVDFRAIQTGGDTKVGSYEIRDQRVSSLLGRKVSLVESSEFEKVRSNLMVSVYLVDPKE